MSPQKPDELLAHLEKLSAEYRIDFAGDLSKSMWPDCHRTILEDAKKLENNKYDTYAVAPNVSQNEPWKLEVKSLAAMLVEKAHRCRQRNESTWRYACEPIILGRLSSEVCCRNCRKRTWRSEVEASRGDDTTAAVNLKNRQKCREPCRCPRMARSQDVLEAAGLNPIFNCRVDEDVHHSPDIANRLKKGERPDRVYGLRQTRNIENLLYDAVKRQFEHDDGAIERQVHEMLGLEQPLKQTGDHLLFPFFVLEAKSGSSNCDWHSIQMQTAFSIRTLLETQNRLQTATGRQSKWRSGPLVWFFANKGEDWRIYAAYMEPTHAESHAIGTIDYRVIDIWRGSILSRDGALQLLLLVDYVFDWARDVYREDIIKELRVLASGDNDAASIVYADSDIHSTRQMDILELPDKANIDGAEFKAYQSAQEAFLKIDSPAGVVRHPTFIESKYCCVLITRDNVQTLLLSIQQTKLQRLCRLVLAQMRDAILLQQEGLDKMEEQWTGTSRLPTSHQHTEAQFHTVISYTTYISPQWHLIRELFAIAVAEDAWPDIISASGLKEGRGKAKIPRVYQKMDGATLWNATKRLQAGSPQQALLAAITRKAVKVAVLRNTPTIKYDDGFFRNIVHFIYGSFKRGNLEPQEPFLRVSNRFDQQHRRNCDVEPFFSESPKVSRKGCVLVTATSNPYQSFRNEFKTDICAYLTADEPRVPSVQALSDIIGEAFETRDVYHSTRNHWSQIISPLAQNVGECKRAWNIENSYGVFSEGFYFLGFLAKLGCGMPKSQGSSRDFSESGSQLYERNFSPWRDPRFVYLDRRERMFVLYKLFTREIAFWRGVGRDRRAQGLSCCECCAAIGDNDMCRDCVNFLQDPNRYKWFKDSLLGKPPFSIKALDKTELGKRLRRSQNHDISLIQYIWNGSHDGPTDDNGDWAWNLDFYAQLEEPFQDISQLKRQWAEFKKYCEASWDWGPVSTSTSKKRKLTLGHDLNDDESEELLSQTEKEDEEED